MRKYIKISLVTIFIITFVYGHDKQENVTVSKFGVKSVKAQIDSISKTMNTIKPEQASRNDSIFTEIYSLKQELLKLQGELSNQTLQIINLRNNSSLKIRQQ